MSTCFVIQPFDKGRFDKRYKDTFEPAIKAAGLVPYRVDRDPSVSIPITEIEDGIRGSIMVFADITLDNPNVWFELGYAIASSKDLCLVCSNERTGHFPFDIQHRAIIRYATESQSDFSDLGSSIARRIDALMTKSEKLQKISETPIKETLGLSQQEIVTLCTIVENMKGLNDWVSYWYVSNDMQKMGFNRLGLNIALKMLKDRNMIQDETHTDRDGESYHVFQPTALGMDWLISNEANLQLRMISDVKDRHDKLDDDIPF